MYFPTHNPLPILFVYYCICLLYYNIMCADCIFFLIKWMCKHIHAIKINAVEEGNMKFMQKYWQIKIFLCDIYWKYSLQNSFFFSSCGNNDTFCKNCISVFSISQFANICKKKLYMCNVCQNLLKNNTMKHKLY